jgi:carbon storage regulator
MLVLSRKIGEVITIGNSIKVTVLGYDRGFVKLGIEAPRSVPVHRQEVYDRISDVNHQAVQTERQNLQAALQAVGLQVRNEEPSGEDDTLSSIQQK